MRRKFSLNRSLFLVSVLIFVASCTVQKRLYNKGFYVQKHTLKANTKNSGELTVVEMDSAIQLNEEVNGIHSTLQEVTTPIEGDPKPQCDTIVLINADTIYGKVAVLNDRWLLMDDCDSVLVNRPTIYRDQLHEIRYADGRVELINDYKRSKKRQLAFQKSQRVFTPFFYLAFGLLLLEIVSVLIAFTGTGGGAFVVFSIVLGIFAIVSNLLSIIFHKRRKKPIALRVSVAQIITAAVVYLSSIIYGFFEYLYY